jgi:hypothetical protein
MNQVLKTHVETNKEVKNFDITYLLFLKYLIIFFFTINVAIHKFMGENKHKYKSAIIA